VYCVLYSPDFSLQAVLRTEADAAGKPAALFAENTKKSVVLAANLAARAALVELGMTAPQAVARCPQLLVRTPKPVADTEASAALLAVAFTIAPTIEDTAPGVCTIDLKGAEPSASERAAAAAIRELDALGFEAAAGIAETPLLALYACRSLVARVAAASLPPNVPASHVLVVRDPASFLGPLPLSAGDPSSEIRDLLSRWGLRTFGDLTTLRRDDIGRRLGPEGLALWDRALGGEPRPLRPVIPAQTFTASFDFEDEVETLEPLLFMLRRFLERLALELRVAGFVAASLDLALKLSDDAAHERSFRLPEPTADVEILFRTLYTHLESLRTDASISGLRLTLSPTRPLVRQQGLFETGLRDPHGFAETLARVGAIVGSDRVGVPRREDSYRPDAIRLDVPPAVVAPPVPPSIHPPIGLPLRRFRPPLAARFELSEGRPTYVWTDRFAGAISVVKGPWQSSGDWWQGDRAWRRTEYDIALETGGLYRVVYADTSWWIEGEYD
jgi:protein ImuB